MSQQTPVPAPKSVANFLSLPNTVKFLQDTLQEKRAEFVSNLISLTSGSSELSACEPAELMKCALNATALNLPLNKNLGYAYIIAYGGVPSFQIGYKGIIQLAIRTGAYRFINATEVREGEISRNKFTGEFTVLTENPNGKIVGYIAYLELMSGFSASLYMSEDEIEKHAIRFSKMYASDKKNKTAKSKWSDPDARPKMALKTVLKGLLGTYGLMTTEFAKAFEQDDENEDVSNGSRSFTDAVVIPQNDPSAPASQGEPSNEPEKLKI